MARPTKEQQEAKRAIEDERIARIVAERMEAAKAEIRAAIESEVLQQVQAIVPPAVPPVEDPGTVNLSKPTSVEGEKGFAQALAMAIAQLSAQGTNKAPYWPPETVEGWRMAQERMANLIIDARVRYGTTNDVEDLPKYKVIKTQYLNEIRIEPQFHDTVTHQMTDQMIRWDEVPNEQMEPANDVARAIYAAFMASIGDAPVKERAAPTAWVRTQKGLVLGVRERSAPGQGFGATTNDPRISTIGQPNRGRHVHLLGTVAAPAVMK